MADPTTDPEGQVSDGSEPTEPDAPITPAEPEGQAPNGDAYDQERAQALIRKLREREKLADREHKELESLRHAEKTRQDADLSEKDRLAKTLAERDAELAAERQQARQRSTRYEAQLAANRLNIIDPDAVVKLLDWDSIDYDDDGRPVDLDAALQALVAEKPYLLRTEAPPRVAGSPTNPASRAPTPGARIYHPDELKDRAFWTANKDDIMRAVREGRIQP